MAARSLLLMLPSLAVMSTAVARRQARRVQGLPYGPGQS